MTDQTTLDTNLNEESISDQALNWVAKLTSGEVVGNTRKEFAAWYDQSDDHVDAFAQAQRLWISLNKSPISLNKSPITVVKAAPKHAPKHLVKRIMLPMAASLAALTLVMQQFFSFPLWQGLTADYVTLQGQQENISLADGSHVALNTNSLLEVNYDKDRRRLKLLSGEADFKVAKDPIRAFEVEVGYWNIKALGTEFIVKSLPHSQELVIAVLEHSVSVTNTRNPSQQFIIEQGETMSLNETQLTSPPKTSPLQHSEFAWKQGKLIFNQTPLAQAIAEIDRYFPGRILLSNQDLKNHKVNGAFDLENVNAIILALEDVLPISVNRFTDYLVVIR